jgi:hypothetical protein
MTARTLSLAERQIKAAFGRLVKECGGGEGAAVSIADATGQSVRQQRMSECGSPTMAVFPRLDEVIALEAVSPVPHVTRTLAMLSGQALRPATVSGPADYFALLSDMTGAHGDLGQQMLAALGDGRIDAREARAALGPARRELEALTALVAKLEAVAHGGGAHG